MQLTSILDPKQLNNEGPALKVDDIVAKLFQRAWRGQNGQQPLGRMLMISDPNEAKDLLSRSADFPKYYSFLTQLGRSRLDTNGLEWEKRRDLTQPLYKEAARTANHRSIDDKYDKWLTDDAIQSGEIGRALLAASSDIFLEALGGSIDTGPIADWLLSLRQTANLAQHIAMFDPTEAQLRNLQSRVALLRQELRLLLAQDHKLAENLNNRLASLDHSIDLLGEVTINLFAGTETTVASISWALNILARRPEEQDFIAEKIMENGSNSPELINLIQEVMRYCPPVPLLARTVLKPNETIGERPVAQGQMIALSIVGLHHNKAFWTNPAEFNPKREEFVKNTYHRRAFLPFSAGPRVCGGLGLARAEVAIALGQILKRYRIDPIATPIKYEMSLNLRPLGTSKLKFEPR